MAVKGRDGDKIVSPAVVSLMACDSANTNGLTLPSGSFAHQMHENDIPCVFASQFPLNIKGSMKLVRVLYRQLLLDGEDPRKSLYDTRKELFDNTNHDWASLIAYTRFPDDINQQLRRYRLNTYLEALKTSNRWSDHIILHKDSIGQDKMELELVFISLRLDKSITSLERLFDALRADNVDENDFAEHSGLMGSAYKRKAEHHFRLSGFYSEKAVNSDADTAKLLKEKAKLAEKESENALAKAREWYNTGFRRVMRNFWTGIQFLSLTAVTRGKLHGDREKEAIIFVRTAAEAQENAKDPMDRIWSWGTLIELYLLKTISVPAGEFVQEKLISFPKAKEFAQKLSGAVATFNGDPNVEKHKIIFAQESTIRQIDRYIWWWPVMYKESFRPELVEMAKEIKEILKDR